MSWIVHKGWRGGLHGGLGVGSERMLRQAVAQGMLYSSSRKRISEMMKKLLGRMEEGLAERVARDVSVGNRTKLRMVTGKQERGQTCEGVLRIEGILLQVISQ